MIAPRILPAWLVFCALAAAQQARIAVVAFDEKSGEPIENLTQANFAVRDGDTALRVEGLERSHKPLDVMLVVDTSMIGQTVRPLVLPLINALEDGDQMALVGYDQSATLLQDFTSSKDLLRQSISGARYGGNPRGIDALYAVLDGGFENTAGRRVAVLLSAGAEGSSRTARGDVYQLARRRSVQVFCVYAEGADAATYERLAENAGGAYFHMKKLDLKPADLAAMIFRNVRSRYELTVSGVYTLSPRLKVEIVNPPTTVKKAVATALVLE